MSDNYFAELVKKLKSDGGFLHFRFITEWYSKHYLIVDDESVHKYISSIVLILCEYVERNNFMTMTQLVNELHLKGHQEAFRKKFKDLTDEMNDKMEYRILAALCGKLVWTEWKKIPGHDSL